MANETMTLISTTTVGAGGTANIEFTNIPQTYTDLVLKISARTTNSPAGFGYNYVGFKVNGSTLTERNLVSDNGSVGSWVGSTMRLDVTSSQNTSNTFSTTEMYFPNYTNTSNQKSFSVDHAFESNGGYYQIGIWAGLYASTSAIASLTYFCPDTNFVQYSTASLYGITKGSGGATIS